MNSVDRMTRLVGSLFLFSLVIMASSVNAATVDTVAFFQSKLGKYKIDLHGGIAPHGNSIGTVENLTDEALITLGYCSESGGFCDIGYRDCPYATTIVREVRMAPDRTVYKISATVGEEKAEYEWEEQKDKVLFRSLNYLLNGEVVPVLEHVLSRIS